MSAQQRLLLNHSLHGEGPSPHPWKPHGRYHQQAGACQLPKTPLTICNRYSGQCPHDGKARRGFFTTQSVQHNADLFLCRVLFACCPADVLDCLRGTRLSCLRFLFHLHSPTGHYDEPETFSYAIPLICSIGADVRQSASGPQNLNSGNLPNFASSSSRKSEG